MNEAVSLAIAALEALPAIVTASEEALGFIEQTVVALRAMQADNRDPTDAEWAALNAQIDTLRAQLGE